jgi:hypothetical protein
VTTLTIEEQRDEFKTALDTILHDDGAHRTYREEPDSVEVPCFVIGNPTFTYDEDFDGDMAYSWPLVLLVSRAADSQRAIQKIDPYTRPTGDYSVRAALASFPSARLVGAGNYGGGYEVGTDFYVGITFEAQVI